jgi:hypothetical protein
MKKKWQHVKLSNIQLPIKIVDNLRRRLLLSLFALVAQPKMGLFLSCSISVHFCGGLKNIRGLGGICLF